MINWIIITARAWIISSKMFLNDYFFSLHDIRLSTTSAPKVYFFIILLNICSVSSLQKLIRSFSMFVLPSIESNSLSAFFFTICLFRSKKNVLFDSIFIKISTLLTSSVNDIFSMSRTVFWSLPVFFSFSFEVIFCLLCSIGGPISRNRFEFHLS